MRPSGRAPDQLRPYSFETEGLNKYAEGVCLVRCGDTHVLCTASVEDRAPGWLKGTGEGWVTAEYGMLPRATDQRTDREAARGKQSGRTQEIQRLIGRSLRAVVDRRTLGELTIKIDCDVLQADGGTRTASITGGYIALAQACRHLQEIEAIKADPLVDSIAAISAGIYRGKGVLDLDYAEDSAAEADANFVITGKGKLVEVQATAEARGFTQDQFTQLMDLAVQGCAQLAQLQAQVQAAGQTTGTELG